MTIGANDLGLQPPQTDGANSLKLFDLTGTLSEAAQRAVRLVERQKIVDALAASKGNKMDAAESLAVSYKTLLSKINDYDLG
jgi:DNA-binding NtrC family response regulator